MGGSIEVQSQVGQGTDVYSGFTFGRSGTKLGGAVKVFCRTYVLLVVDDDPDACAYAGLLLKRMKVRYDCA
jgi:hypothetical protein